MLVKGCTMHLKAVRTIGKDAFNLGAQVLLQYINGNILFVIKRSATSTRVSDSVYRNRWHTALRRTFRCRSRGSKTFDV
jgi:hypothetical protein